MRKYKKFIVNIDYLHRYAYKYNFKYFIKQVLINFLIILKIYHLIMINLIKSNDKIVFMNKIIL